MNNFDLQRRSLLFGTAGAALAGAALGQRISTDKAAIDPGRPLIGRDTLAASYDVSDNTVNLENAYYGIMARPVADDYKRNIDFLNRHHSHYLRTHFDQDGIEAIRTQLAAHAGVATDELAITRGATESLQCLVGNYLPLKAGETVMIGNLDYGSVMDAMRDLAQRRGASVATVDLPEPATRQNVIDAYELALRRHPRTRLLLLTHISHRTGLVLPVADIVRMAKARNVDVVVDVAQSWGQLDFSIPDLGADFVGANLHKWVGAPLGLGFLYIRSARLSDIRIPQGNSEFPSTDIRARVHAGTLNVAAVMTIPAALAFHGRLPLPARAALLLALRNYWVAQARDIPAMQILTPDEPGMTGAVTSFRFAGHTSFEANVALTRKLAKEHGIFTVARNGPIGGSCVRVTPSYYTHKGHLDLLVMALRRIAV